MSSLDNSSSSDPRNPFLKASQPRPVQSATEARRVVSHCLQPADEAIANKLLEDFDRITTKISKSDKNLRKRLQQVFQKGSPPANRMRAIARLANSTEGHDLLAHLRQTDEALPITIGRLQLQDLQYEIERFTYEASRQGLLAAGDADAAEARLRQDSANRKRAANLPDAQRSGLELAAHDLVTAYLHQKEGWEHDWKSASTSVVAIANGMLEVIETDLAIRTTYADTILNTQDREARTGIFNDAARSIRNWRKARQNYLYARYPILEHKVELVLTGVALGTVLIFLKHFGLTPLFSQPDPNHKNPNSQVLYVDTQDDTPGKASDEPSSSASTGSRTRPAPAAPTTTSDLDRRIAEHSKNMDDFLPWRKTSGSHSSMESPEKPYTDPGDLYASAEPLDFGPPIQSYLGEISIH